VIKVFVSHASADRELAKAFVKLLMTKVRLENSEVRCTSLPGFRHGTGSHTSNTLRDDLGGSKVLIGLLTPSSLNSGWVLFELGAAWGMNTWTVPILVGAEPSDLPGPLGERNAIFGNSQDDVGETINQLSAMLGERKKTVSEFVTALSMFTSVCANYAGGNAMEHTEEVAEDDEDQEFDEDEHLAFLLEEASTASLKSYLKSNHENHRGDREQLVARIVDEFSWNGEDVLVNVYTYDELCDMAHLYGYRLRGSAEKMAEELLSREP
jgi:hypothetical protein